MQTAVIGVVKTGDRRGGGGSAGPLAVEATASR